MCAAEVQVLCDGDMSGRRMARSRSPAEESRMKRMVAGEYMGGMALPENSIKKGYMKGWWLSECLQCIENVIARHEASTRSD